MADAKLPIAQSGGEGNESGRDEESYHSAIAAFHGGNQRRARFAYVATSARFIRGTGGVVFGLTFVAITGGLFLAHVSVTGPDHAITIGLLAPEIIYKRPVTSVNAMVAERAGPWTAPAPDDAAAISSARAASSFEEMARWVGGSGQPCETEGPTAIASLVQASLPDATANFAAALRLNAIGGAQNAGSASFITSGFAAEELPSVPEPATEPAIALVLALIGLQRWFRRSHASVALPSKLD